MREEDTVNLDLKRRLDRIGVQLERVFVRAGEMMIQRGKQLANERLTNPGTFQDCWWFEVRREVDNIVLEFGNYHEAAIILEYGTKRGYQIPRMPTGVWFFKHGKWIRKAQIVHPGIEAKHIVEDAFSQIKEGLAAEVQNIMVS